MKAMGAAVLLGFLGLGAGVAWADDSPLEANVVVDTGQDSSNVSTATYGDGQEHVVTPRYSVTLHNKGMDAIPKIGLKLYVIGGDDYVKSFAPAKFKMAVVKVLEKEDISLDSTADITEEMGQVEFKTQATRNGLMLWFSGISYEGYALEIYIDGQKVDVKYGGTQNVQQPYEEYLKKAS